MLRRLLEAAVLPPGSVLLLLVLGGLLALRWRRLGRSLQALGFLWLWIASTPWVAGHLLATLQQHPALPTTGPLPDVDAIVVLSAEADRQGAEYGGPTVGTMTLQRLRYAAALQRRTSLPLLVSGGKPTADCPPLAELMAKTLRDEFGVTARFQEDRSTDTRENAEFSAALLRQAGLKRILLVSSAWHLPRAAAAFRAEGLDVVPAPTGFRGPSDEGDASFVPHWQALRDTSYALHEWCGRLWYCLRG